MKPVIIHYFLIHISFLSGNNALILSKSKIEMCENRGLHGKGDPQNLVDGKACEKKMVVLMTVTNGQVKGGFLQDKKVIIVYSGTSLVSFYANNEVKENSVYVNNQVKENLGYGVRLNGTILKEGVEKLRATISRVRDQTKGEYARMYNPFLITLSKSPVTYNFPTYYTGYSVNNKPFEEIRMAKGSWFDSDSSKRCYDQWQHVEKATLKPICGYQYQVLKVKQMDGSYKNVRKRIWDSQGFCCHCTGDEKSAKREKEARNVKRSGIKCEFFTKKPQAAGHCMRMDALWYTVHELGQAYKDFTIHVKAYDQIEKVLKDRTVIEDVNGGEIILSPSRKSGVGKYQRIIAHYVGDFSLNTELPVLSERYFLIPRKGDGIDPRDHEQTRDGVEKYLILLMSDVDLRGGKCDRVGVSYSSFKAQAAGGVGPGCLAKKGSCLRNQPYHYFKDSMKALALRNFKTNFWFPTRYGKLKGLKKKVNADAADQMNNALLSYELEEDHVSLVTLQISADDVTFIYNRATGEITRAAVKDFEALTMDGELQVEVLNTGFVTASFHIGVVECSEGIHKIKERSASIDPQKTHKLVFKIRTSKRVGETFSCTVQLFDTKRELLGKRNISFSTSTPCTCEVMNCKCECDKNGGVKCIEAEGSWKISDKIWEVKSAGTWFDTVGEFFGGINKWPGKIFGGISSVFSNLFGKGLWKYLRYGMLALVFLLLACVVMNCCGPMIMTFIKTRLFAGRSVEKSPNYDRVSSSEEEVHHGKSRKSNRKKRQAYSEDEGSDFDDRSRKTGGVNQRSIPKSDYYRSPDENEYFSLKENKRQQDTERHETPSETIKIQQQESNPPSYDNIDWAAKEMNDTVVRKNQPN